MKKPYNQTQLKTLWSRARYFLTLLKVRVFRMDNPVICVLVLNNRCNFRCKYCFGSYHSREIKDYTTEELKTLIDELYRLGTRYLNIHGGETLLRNDIGEIVDYIKSKGMYCCLITNGSLLKHKLNEIRNVDNLTISLDGSKENNDKNRGAGSYDVTLEAIKLAKKEGLPLRVSATLTKYSMNDIGFLAELAKKHDFTVHFSILFKPLPQFQDMELNNEEIKRAADSIIEYKRKGYPIFTSYRAAEYAGKWPLNHNEYHYILEKDLHKLPKNFRHIECFYGKNKFTIEADGNVYPCFLLGDPDKFRALNWKEVGVKRAFEHVRETNTCITCPAMTQNDHNLLLGLNAKQVICIIRDQIKEAFRRE